MQILKNDEFVQRAIEEDEVLYLRGRVLRMYRDEGKIIVVGADTLWGANVQIRADMMVLEQECRLFSRIEFAKWIDKGAFK